MTLQTSDTLTAHRLVRRDLILKNQVLFGMLVYSILKDLLYCIRPNLNFHEIKFREGWGDQMFSNLPPPYPGILADSTTKKRMNATFDDKSPYMDDHF